MDEFITMVFHHLVGRCECMLHVFSLSSNVQDQIHLDRFKFVHMTCFWILKNCFKMFDLSLLHCFECLELFSFGSSLYANS